MPSVEGSEENIQIMIKKSNNSIHKKNIRLCIYIATDNNLSIPDSVCDVK